MLTTDWHGTESRGKSLSLFVVRVITGCGNHDMVRGHHCDGCRYTVFDGFIKVPPYISTTILILRQLNLDLQFF